MNTYVLTYNEIEGIHYWENAISPVEFLKHPHRHVFVIKCQFEVTDDDRQIEIIIQQNKIKDYIEKKFGYPALFKNMSCEMIAKDIILNFKNCSICEILEDGYGGAKVRR